MDKVGPACTITPIAGDPIARSTALRTCACLSEGAPITGDPTARSTAIKACTPGAFLLGRRRLAFGVRLRLALAMGTRLALVRPDAGATNTRSGRYILSGAYRHHITLATRAPFDERRHVISPQRQRGLHFALKTRAVGGQARCRVARDGKYACLAPIRHARSRTCFGAYDQRPRGKSGGLRRFQDDLREWVQGKMEQPDKIRFDLPRGPPLAIAFAMTQLHLVA